MKKILLVTVMLIMTMAVVAQTYNNPRQKSNDRNLKVIKVERTSNSTIVYLRYTPDDTDSGSNLQAYPRLVDEATGKKYQATDALNFKWGTRYVGNATYKIEFPPLPKSTSVVTFREAASVEDPWVIRNIALPIQGQQKKTQSNQASTNKASTSSGYSKTYNNPSQSTNNKSVKVTKVIRTNEYTIVHFTYNITEYMGKALNTSKMRLVDDDIEKMYKVTKALNFTNDKKYTGNLIFKVQFPPLPRSTSVVRFQQSKDGWDYEGWSIIMQLP
ncbi:MAG: hypothetical protein IJK46_12855 [Prevotella sp.]|nr:hypothetical protein [Prevotella sp.]